MGNLLQYTDKSSTINNKLAALLAQITYDYNNGRIRTETEYYYRVKNMLKEFQDSLTKPTFKFRPAISTPMSDEYNAMITESYNDMDYIIKDCEALSKLVSQSFTDAELSRTMMANELAYLTKKVAAIGESVARNQPIGTVVFTELFNDFEYVGNFYAPDACQITANDGILTLRRGSYSTHTIKEIQIDNEVSNGFPGNTHCVDTLNNELHFVGQNGLHCDISTICDNQQDTWFEFELFSITDEVRRECNSFGFEYNEGISWVNNEDLLRLKIVIYPGSTMDCSWITLVPYLSDIKGVKSCFVESCNIISASNNVYQVAKNQPFDDTLVLPFPPQKIQRVEITFVQPSKYLTKVGHFYHTCADTTSLSIFQEYDYSDKFARVDGEKPSVSLLNCKYNPVTKWIDYPSTKTEKLEPNYMKDGLFKAPPSTIEKKSSQEVIDAYRSMIGIRDIRISSCVFDLYGEYVSVPFYTDEPITSIVLETSEYIPGSNEETLRYFISLNGGITWHKIYPIHRAYGGIYKYYVNNDTIENMLASDTKDRRSKNLSVVGDCRQIQLKIEMNRPDTIQDERGLWVVNDEYYDPDKTAPYSTPIVYEYRLKLTTGGETIEY